MTRIGGRQALLTLRFLFRGLCGGMVFAAKDFHEFREPQLPDATAPAQGTPLFDYFVARLIAGWAASCTNGVRPLI
jgi:hypothetical protein